jgi:hypothetical protein
VEKDNYDYRSDDSEIGPESETESPDTDPELVTFEIDDSGFNFIISSLLCYLVLYH